MAAEHPQTIPPWSEGWLYPARLCAISSGAGFGACGYAPGHYLHVIPATRASERPGTWRHAVVVRVDRQRHVATLRCAEGTVVQVWHHRPFDELDPGTRVMLCARYMILKTPRRLVGVALDVEPPAGPDDERVVRGLRPIPVDNGSGEGLLLGR